MARTCGLASWYSISPNVDMGLSQTSKSLRRTGFYRDSPGSCHLDRARRSRSEEHTSELQSQSNLVCRLLLETIELAVFQTRLAVLTPAAPVLDWPLLDERVQEKERLAALEHVVACRLQLRPLVRLLLPQPRS